MIGRHPRELRRDQVVHAALELLATRPLDALTTREIARRVGVTQPGLFRHFRSRDEILMAVLADVRASLAAVARAILERGQPPLATARAVLGAIIEFAAEHPGVPRLLFHDSGAAGDADLRVAMRALVSTQRSLLAALLSDAVAGGALPDELDTERAAELGVAALQGALLQWLLADREIDLSALGGALIEHWVAGLEAGAPRRPTGALARSATAATGPAISSVDTRPLLRAGTDPLPRILDALARLPGDGVLRVSADFRPDPLLALLSARGLRASCRASGEASWTVEVLGADAPPVIDLCELAAPEPLERVLSLTGADATATVLLFRLPRFPRLLLPHLEARAFAYLVCEDTDGTALLHLRRRT